jgi:pilus assembly protein FimV
MNTKLTTRSICAVGLGAWAALASALSLGPVTGTTVVGRPLEVSAPIQFDELAQGNGSGCVTAEVLYGAKAAQRARVQVDLGADAARQLSYARISSPAPVDEPFVTLVLHAGCGRQVTRRYLLLAEAPREEPVTLATASALAAPTAAPRAAAPAPRSQAAVDTPARPAPVAAVAPPRASLAHRFALVAREHVLRDGGRLQLAVWDPNSEQQLPWLRASDRLRGLEGEVSSLRTVSARHRAEISSASASLLDTRSQRRTGLLLTVLLALLAGSSAAFFWHRTRSAGMAADQASWYGPIEPGSDADVVVQEHQHVQHVPLVPRRASEVLQPLAFTPPEATPAPPALVHGRDRGGLRVDALLGAQQQSEFFASLGQVDEAVAVLTSYLQEASEQPVLPFLALFQIYHGTGMRKEYEQLQSTFRQDFGMDVASFGQYKDELRELELYPVAITRIAMAWPSEKSQDIIEELLFKRPATPRELLSLEAYRELLWLYSLGQDVVHNTAQPARLQLPGDRGRPNDHFILPWATSEQEGPPELSLAQLDTIEVAPELNAFAVDIDLTSMRSDTHAAAVELQLPQARPQAAPDSSLADLDAFDAAMATESRKRVR